jgi:alpha-glucosidase
LSFLPAGTYELQSYEDGPNADRFGSDYRHTVTRVDKNTKLKIKLAGGGGWAGRIRKSTNRQR